MSVWDAAAAPERVPGLTRAAVNALREFMDTMAELRERNREGVEVAELLTAVLEQTGYVRALEAEGTIEAEGRHQEPRAARRGRARVRQLR